MNKRLAILILIVCILTFTSAFFQDKITGFGIVRITADGDEDWPMFRQNATRVGVADSSGPTNDNVMWTVSVDVEEDLLASPIAKDGVVYVSSYSDQKMYALNASNGSEIWSYTAQAEVLSTPAVADDILYFGANDNQVYALNATNGSSIWNHSAAGGVQSSPVVVDGVIYIGVPDDNITALYANNGSFIWNYSTENDVVSSPAVANGIVYVGSQDYNIYALNASNGSKIWNYTTAGAVESSPAVADGIIYVGTKGGNVTALNASNGSFIWNYTTGGIVVSSPAVSGGIVYVGSLDNKTYALNATNGNEIWNYSTGDAVQSSPAIANGIVYIGSEDNKTYALNASNGNEIWSYTTGGDVVSSPAIADGILYISSVIDDKLYAFGPSTNLIPTEIDYSPLGPQTGDAVNISITVENTGDVNTTSSFNVSLYIDGTYENDINISSLNASSQAIASFIWTAESELHQIKVFVDSDDNIDEINDETDNNLTRMIGVDWPMMGQTVERYSVANTNGPTTSNVLWTKSITTKSKSISISNNLIYVTGDSNKIYALNIDTGSTNWTYTIDDAQANVLGDSSPTIYNDMVYIGTYNNDTLYVLNATNGTLIWKYNAGEHIDSSPLVADEIVYMTSDNLLDVAKVYARNATNGSEIWNYSLGSTFSSSPSISNGIIYVGCYDNKLYALNASNGNSIWNYTTGGNVIFSPAIADGVVYIGSADWKVYAINATNGNKIWDYNMSGPAGSPAIANGVVYVSTSEVVNVIRALNATNGSDIWNSSISSAGTIPAIADNLIYTGGSSGNFYALNKNTGEVIWNYHDTLSEAAFTPILYNSKIYTGSQTNIFAFGPAPPRGGSGGEVITITCISEGYVCCKQGTTNASTYPYLDNTCLADQKCYSECLTTCTDFGFTCCADCEPGSAKSQYDLTCSNETVCCSIGGCAGRLTCAAAGFICSDDCPLGAEMSNYNATCHVPGQVCCLNFAMRITDRLKGATRKIKQIVKTQMYWLILATLIIAGSAIGLTFFYLFKRKKCPYCDRRFYMKMTLKKHIAKSHKKKTKVKK